MSTTAVSAAQIMDRVAILLNDPNKTDYTYAVIQPYLNMAIEELSEITEESNNSPSNRTSNPILVPVGKAQLVPIEDPIPSGIAYPEELVEVQGVLERLAGTNDSFVRMTKLEFLKPFPPGNALLYWMWEDQHIKFNPGGALTPREVLLETIVQSIPYVLDPSTIITMINSRAFLSYKTAALCALFIGENESRSQTLDDLADKAMERSTAISNKGRQQIMTRHRPFRAGWKSRGWI